MSRVRIAPQGELTTDWAQGLDPAVNTQATCTQQAPGAGLRNVCTGLTVMLCGGTSAPSVVVLKAYLIDGASGGTSYKWRATISLPATAGAPSGIVRQGIWIPGSANTAMTLEFSANGGANTFESVSMEGTVQVV